MNNIFQTTLTKTNFGFDASQPNEAGLGSYLQAERQLIENHLAKGSGGLVMGGFSGIGKTALATDILKLIGGKIVGHLFDLEDQEAQKHYENKHSSNKVIIDEGMSLTELNKKGSQWLKMFLDTKTARVVLGGGTALTGKEQTTAISNALTAMGVNVQSTHTFQILRMSDLQIAQMIVGNSMSASQAHKEGSLDIKLIADACTNIVDPLRIPGHINTCIDLYTGKVKYNPSNYVIATKGFSIVPGKEKYHQQMIELFGEE